MLMKLIVVACIIKYKHIAIINDDTSIVNNDECHLQMTPVIVYNRNLFIIQATFPSSQMLGWNKLECLIPARVWDLSNIYGKATLKVGFG